jgi:rubrerythrin
MNVIDYALQMEADGKAYYQRLADQCGSPELQNLFSLLADAEQSHYDALARRRGEMDATAGNALMESAKNAFLRLTEMNSKAPFLVDRDGYRHAVKAEEQSIGFYEKCAEKEESPEVRRLLQTLAEEERIHLNIVENIYDFVLSPKCFLAWREFSNLRDL